MEKTARLVDIESIVSHISDGDMVALPSSLSGDFSATSMVTTRALIRRGVRNLHLLGVPALNFQADLLIGASCVRTAEAGSVLMYEYGHANRFVAAQRQGAIEVVDSTCPAINAGLIAGDKGIPFMTVRGIIGSDLLRLHERRGDWRVIDNPFGAGDPVVAVAAIRPDVTLFHAPLADRHGNVWFGRRDALATMARAAKKTLVTFEAFHDGDLLDSNELAPATIPALFVTALSHQPKGAWPLDGGEHSPEDAAHLREYARLSKTEAGFAQYLERYVMAERLAVDA